MHTNELNMTGNIPGSEASCHRTAAIYQSYRIILRLAACSLPAGEQSLEAPQLRWELFETSSYPAPHPCQGALYPFTGQSTTFQHLGAFLGMPEIDRDILDVSSFFIQ